MCEDKTEKLIFDFLNLSYKGEFRWEINSRASREFILHYNDKRLLMLNTQSDFIQFEYSYLRDLSEWFGNQNGISYYRQIFTRWLLLKYRVNTTHDLTITVINNNLRSNNLVG